MATRQAWPDSSQPCSSRAACHHLRQGPQLPPELQWSTHCHTHPSFRMPVACASAPSLGCPPGSWDCVRAITTSWGRGLASPATSASTAWTLQRPAWRTVGSPQSQELTLGVPELWVTCHPLAERVSAGHSAHSFSPTPVSTPHFYIFNSVTSLFRTEGYIIFLCC